MRTDTMIGAGMVVIEDMAMVDMVAEVGSEGGVSGAAEGTVVIGAAVLEAEGAVGMEEGDIRVSMVKSHLYDI